MGSKQNPQKKWLQEARDCQSQPVAVDLSFGYVGDEGDERGLWRWMRLDEGPLNLAL